jgi:hypothetical protein
MPEIMIRCPTLGTAVKTGLRTETIVLDSLPNLPIPMRCPACRKVHRWQRKDAWVDTGKGQDRSPYRERRRAALARALKLLEGLTSCLKPLVAESAKPEPVAEALQTLFDWVAEERERVAVLPRSADGARDDHA